MPAIITLSGIDEALSNLQYKNPNALKPKLINAIRSYYFDELPIEHLGEIDADQLVRSLWANENDPKVIKNKRRNLSSLRSSINTELERLYNEGKNPEGVTIGPAYTFEMSNEAKDKILNRFVYQTDENSPFEMSQIMDVLSIVHDILERPEHLSESEGDSESKLEKIKELIKNISDKVNLKGEKEFVYIEKEKNNGKLDTGLENTAENNGDPGDGEGGRGYDTAEGDRLDSEKQKEFIEGQKESIEEDIEELKVISEEKEFDDSEIIDAEEIEGEIEEIEEDEEFEAAEYEDFLDEDFLLEEDDEFAEMEIEDEDEEDEELFEVDEAEDNLEDDLNEEDELVEIADDEELEEVEIADDIKEEDEVVDLAEDEELEETEEDDLEEVDVVEDDEEIEEEVGDEEEEVIEDEEELDEVDAEEELAETDELVELAEDEELEEVNADDEIEEEDELVELSDEEELEETEEDDLEEIASDEDFAEEDEIVDLVADEDLEEAEEDDLEEVDVLEGDEEIEDVEDETEEVIDDKGELEEVEVADEIEEEDDLVDLAADEDLEEAEADDLEEVDIIDDDDFDEEPDEARKLAKQFDDYLAEMDQIYNQYVPVPKGTYIIGNKKPKRDELLAEKVLIESFNIGKFPVTNALFEVFIEKTGYKTTAEKLGYGTVCDGRYQSVVDEETGLKTVNWSSTLTNRIVEGACWYQPLGPGSNLHKKRNHPVVQVSWEDAMAFAAWTGKRLPLEKEWEAAARTKKGNPLPWGKRWKRDSCNFDESYIGGTTPVNHYINHVNGLGLADTLGNVMEWTKDEVQYTDHKKGQLTYCIAKGGSFISGKNIRLYSRFILESTSCSNIVGFRCVAL